MSHPQVASAVFDKGGDMVAIQAIGVRGVIEEVREATGSAVEAVKAAS